MLHIYTGLKHTYCGWSKCTQNSKGISNSDWDVRLKLCSICDDTKSVRFELFQNLCFENKGLNRIKTSETVLLMYTIVTCHLCLIWQLVFIPTFFGLGYDVMFSSDCVLTTVLDCYSDYWISPN